MCGRDWSSDVCSSDLCNFSSSPEETKKINGICPICKKSLTIGVENRVEELASLDFDYKTKKLFFKILPLHELISLCLGVSMNSKRVWNVYDKLITKFGNEFNILLNAEESELKQILDSKLIEIILRNREGKINVKPGYDGVYGEALQDKPEKQNKLF
jgi:PHP family Zn ribbon phosphoesterase